MSQEKLLSAPFPIPTQLKFLGGLGHCLYALGVWTIICAAAYISTIDDSVVINLDKRKSATSNFESKRMVTLLYGSGILSIQMLVILMFFMNRAGAETSALKIGLFHLWGGLLIVEMCCIVFGIIFLASLHSGNNMTRKAFLPLCSGAIFSAGLWTLAFPIVYANAISTVVEDTKSMDWFLYFLGVFFSIGVLLLLYALVYFRRNGNVSQMSRLQCALLFCAAVFTVSIWTMVFITIYFAKTNVANVTNVSWTSTMPSLFTAAIVLVLMTVKRIRVDTHFIGKDVISTYYHVLVSASTVMGLTMSFTTFYSHCLERPYTSPVFGMGVSQVSFSVSSMLMCVFLKLSHLSHI